MKKRINLLKANKNFVDREAVFSELKNTFVVFFFILLLVNISIYFYLIRQNQEITQIAEQKKFLIEFFVQNKEADAKFAYFRNKEGQLKDILRQDVSFYPYYNLLKTSLDKFAVGAELYSVTIDKTKTTNFTIIFEEYEHLISFLKFAESEEFLKNFNQLSMVDFTKNETQLTKNDYRLNFSGKFINLSDVP